VGNGSFNAPIRTVARIPENYNNLTLVDTYPFLCKNALEVRLITVDALERNPSGRRTIIRNDITSGSVHATQGGAASVRRPMGGVSAKPNSKRSAKGRIKSSTVAIYASVFVLIVSIIAVGYRSPEESTTAASAAPVATTAVATEQPAVNDVVATDIAASVASAASLAIAPNVAELAVSTRVQSEFAGASDSTSITKPVIVQLSEASRKISTYAVVEGDTVASVAAKFGVSESTIRWANNLKDSDTLAAGSSIDVLPVNGIAYTVKDGDTIEKIAEKYKVSTTAIATYNDLELQGVSTGLKIIIPGGDLPSNERPGYVAPVAAATSGTFITGYSGGFSGGATWYIGGFTGSSGGYAYGNCTSYAHWKRAQIGRPIGNMWGNAGTWASRAAAQGYTVNKTPAPGAVIQDWGHVAIVEKVLPNGDLELSEMNASVPGGGYNRVSGRILPAGQIGQYMYIH
jgi:N-acetylmuramoyl-L-alanine amidase